MKMKTYIVSSLTEAVEQIKRELGPNAVILSTRKSTTTDGKWWKTKRPALEVTAALDSELRGDFTPVSTPAVKEVTPNSQSFHEAVQLLSQLTEDKLNLFKQEIQNLQKSISEINQQKEVVASSSETANLSTVVYETQTLPLKDGLISDTSRLLLDQELDTDILQQLSHYLMESGSSKNNKNFSQTVDSACEWFIHHMPKTTPYQAGIDPRIIALVGPTGSGKTTTLAKLGSILALDQKKKVGFISVDHFRIGAEDQIRKYAYLLKAPCELVTTPEALEKALERMKDLDVILVDTIGRSPRDSEGIALLSQTLKVLGNAWISFVGAATLKSRDLKRALEAFAPTGFSKLILTKLDETQEFGSLYNATFKTQLPLAYFTLGQNVPEDIEPATSERILDCLFDFSGNQNSNENQNRNLGETVS